GVTAEIHIDAVAIDTLHDATHQLPYSVAVLLNDLGALGFAHLLHDDLLGLLRGDTAERDRLHRLLDEAAGLNRRVDVAAIFEPELTLGYFEFRGVIGEHLPAAKG